MTRLLVVVIVILGAAIYLARLLALRRVDRIALLRAAFLSRASVQRPYGPELKEVVLRSGRLRLRIPRHWAESYPAEDEAVFHDAARPERLLRIVFRRLPARAAALRDTLVAQAKTAAHCIEELPREGALLKELITARENSKDCIVFRWLIAATGTSAETIETAACTYTVLESVAREPLLWDDLALIEQELRAARVGTA